MVNNFNNYFIYSELVKTGKQVVKSQDINMENWRNHYDGIFNILQDGIELKEVHQLFITVDFGNGDFVDLTVDDFLFNLIMWHSIVMLNQEIKPYHVIFKKNTRSKDIKTFIDRFVIIPNRKTVNTKILNNVIAETLYPFLDLDDFSMFLANTLNLEDDIELMEACPEFDQLIHCDMSGVPVEQVKDRGMDVVYRAIDLILDSKKIMGHEHCLKNPFAAEEGINKKQYRENHYNIGTKPDGQGSIYHEIINQSYITGGLNTFVNQFIDCATARVAQIISKKNVGESGGFSRILGLNNIDTYLNPDPNYSCSTKNLVPITITNKTILSKMKNRTFKYVPNGMEFELDDNDTSLIGKRLLFRSPVTCASYAAGHGICHACYGRSLANINSNINIGRIATEIVTEQYTQMRLSAKHLLETLIKVNHWCPEFSDFLDIDINIIRLSETAFDENRPIDGWCLKIKEDDIQLENDDDFFQHLFYSDDEKDADDSVQLYNEFVTDFVICSPDSQDYHIHSEDEDDTSTKMFLSKDFKNIIKSFLKSSHKDEYLDNGELSIPLSMLQEKDLFTLKIQNNDLGKALDVFTDLINKKNVTKSFTIPTLIERLQLATINGNISVDSVHLEIILSNQVRDANDRLSMVDWNNPNAEYEILTLNEALTDNPSPIISLLYQKLAKVLNYPLTFKKCKPSIFDPFFMRKPKKYLNADHEIYDLNKPRIGKGESPVVFSVNHEGERPRNIKKFLEPFRKDFPKTELDD